MYFVCTRIDDLYTVFYVIPIYRPLLYILNRYYMCFLHYSHYIYIETPSDMRPVSYSFNGAHTLPVTSKTRLYQRVQSDLCAHTLTGKSKNTHQTGSPPHSGGQGGAATLRCHSTSLRSISRRTGSHLFVLDGV